MLVFLLKVQPILAALPVDGWQNQLALSQLARPGVYLVLFQNHRELRPTGGFLGTFAEVEVGWGFKVKKITVETNIYTRDKTYADHLNMDPPPGLSEFLRGEIPWSLRDSNWALDFPESADTISWFYAQEGGRPVDGVIATDSRLLERLLTLTGPITIDDLTVDAETVIDALQSEVEKNYWDDPGNRIENQPKGIIADLLPAVLAELSNQPRPALFAALTEAFAAKELLVSVKNQTVARALKDNNWDGHSADTDGDYLYVNEANLTAAPPIRRTVGAKSSASIDRTLELNRLPQADGSLTHQLTLARHHSGQLVWPDGPNHSYLRVAVPQGSTLVSITRNGEPIGEETRLSHEAGKTVISFWSRLNPGDRDIFHLVYQTPALAEDTLTLQRQPGVLSYPVTIYTENTLRWSGDLTQDQVI